MHSCSFINFGHRLPRFLSAGSNGRVLIVQSISDTIPHGYASMISPVETLDLGGACGKSWRADANPAGMPHVR
jgi:hypothetical protein